MSRFRVATYNVHKCKGLDWRVSWERVARVVGELEADVIAAQELSQGQAEAISRRAELPFVFGCARRHEGEPYGNAIFSRLAVLSSENYDLTIRGYEPRQCLRVSVSLSQTEALHFFAVHLGTSYRERREQAHRLVSGAILDRNEFKGGRVIAGDFNEWTSGLTTKLLRERLLSADIRMHLKRRRTYPGALPFLHLDHIYYDAQFCLREMKLHKTWTALAASDHLPLSALFETANGGS